MGTRPRFDLFMQCPVRIDGVLESSVINDITSTLRRNSDIASNNMLGHATQHSQALTTS
jgi:hypothetical protein